MDAYPPGYADPPFDGTPDGFRDVVLPARIAAIEQTLSDLLPDGLHVRFDATSDDTHPAAP